jgi:hypothetical protein
MPEYITDNIVETNAPQAPYEGTGFKPTEELVAGLMFDSTYLKSAKESAGHLLGIAGIRTELLSDPNSEGLVRETLSKQIDANKILIESSYNLANKMLNPLKQKLVNALSDYGSHLGFDQIMLQRIFEKRLQTISEVKVDDTVTQGRSFNRVDGVAHFDAGSGEVRFRPDVIVDQAISQDIEPKKQLERDLLHELMHTASFMAKAEEVDYVTRKGIAAMPSLEGYSGGVHAWTGTQLLEEGAQEDIRWRHLDGTPPSYEKSVMFWESAIALDPSLERDRFGVKFLNEGRGSLIGKIENIFGPGAVEIIEADLGDYARFRDYPDWKDKIVAMVEGGSVEESTAMRLKAREVLDSVQSEILKARGSDYSDEEYRIAKRDGIALPRKTTVR